MFLLISPDVSSTIIAYGVDVKVFGSCATGLALPSSDIDLLVTGFEHSEVSEIREILEFISKQLKEYPWAVSVKPILSAVVPVVKIVMFRNEVFFLKNILGD